MKLDKWGPNLQSFSVELKEVVLKTNIFLVLNKLLRTIDFPNLQFPGKRSRKDTI